ncbi:ARL14 effector protein-like, partial [Leucoraja erinacea]|uniref:ARL14 effector protein-like n=1 Tax=Leucoraja erinaceus TaxID=7782 RepID=UPI0024547478
LAAHLANGCWQLSALFHGHWWASWALTALPGAGPAPTGARARRRPTVARGRHDGETEGGAEAAEAGERVGAREACGSAGSGPAPGTTALNAPGEWWLVRSTKALRSLQFANPARQKTEFTPGTSRREKRKLQAKQPSQSNADRQTMPIKSKVYDSQGVLIVSKRDRCDCLDEDCLGCFYPCPSCDSQKCGIECRCDRKWLYEQIEVEGGEVIRNKNVN